MIQQNFVNDYQQHANDTGSTSVQVSLLTNKVVKLTQHLKTHKKDYASQRGLWRMLGQRKQLLKYLFNRDPMAYDNLILGLGIRGIKMK